MSNPTMRSYYVENLTFADCGDAAFFPPF